MKTKTINLYTLDELTEVAKEKAREWYKEGNDYRDLLDEMNEELHVLLKEHGMKGDDVEVFYSLSYCQGDGAMFVGRVQWKSYTADIKQSGHYYHENSKSYSLVSTKTDKEASEKAYADFENLYVNICNTLEKKGYEYIEYENSDESVDDNIMANDYTFTGEGKREN